VDIKDIFERVLLKSGQFVLSTGKIEIKIDAFRLLVEDSLAVYNRYSPVDKLYNFEIYYPRQFDWSVNIDPVFGRVPDWVATANPMRYGGGSIGGILLREGQLNGQNELIDPIQSPWRYDSPYLTVSHSARYEIKAVYEHIIEENQSEPDAEKCYVIKTITVKDQPLFDHIRSQFLLGIGRSRRAFTMNDLPITMDASEIASEGKDLEEKALKDMQNYQKFYLTHG
jgi:hypothetical protein